MSKNTDLTQEQRDERTYRLADQAGKINMTLCLIMMLAMITALIFQDQMVFTWICLGLLAAVLVSSIPFFFWLNRSIDVLARHNNEDEQRLRAMEERYLDKG